MVNKIRIKLQLPSFIGMYRLIQQIFFKAKKEVRHFVVVVVGQSWCLVVFL